MRSVETHLLSMALAWTFLFGFISYYVPLLKFASTLVLTQFFMGMFFEYLKPRIRIILLGFNFLCHTPVILQVWVFIHDFMNTLHPIISDTIFDYPEWFISITSVASLFSMFFIEPFGFWKMLKKIGFYGMAENRLPILLALKGDKS